MDKYENIKDDIPYVVLEDGNIIETSKQFTLLTDYEQRELLGKSLQELFDLLRINGVSRLSEPHQKWEGHIFTKSLEAREVEISHQTFKDLNQEIYYIKEKENSQLRENHPYIDQLYENNIEGVAIHSVPELILLKANDIYLNFLDYPYNKRELALGRKQCEIITGFKGSNVEALWNEVIEKGRMMHIGEYEYDNLKRGKTYWDIMLVPIKVAGEVKCIIETSRDITETVMNRKVIEEQSKTIQQKNMQLEAVIGNMSDGLFTLDKDNNYTLLNESAKEFFYNSDSVNRVGDSFAHTKYYDGQKNIIQVENMPGFRVLRGETIKEYRIIEERPDGIFHFSISGSPVYDDYGNIIKAIICTRNITNQIKGVENIRLQKAQLETIFENMTDGISIFNSEGKYISFNEAAKRMFFPSYGYMNKIGDGHIQTELFNEDGRKLDIEEIPASRVMRGEKFTNMRMNIKFPDKTLYIDISGTPIYDSDGNLAMGVLCSRDVTKYIKQEEEIRKQKKQLEAIINSMSDGLELVDSQRNIRFLNQAVREFFYKPDSKLRAGDSLKYNKYYYGIDGDEIPKEDLPTFKVFNKGSYQNYILTIDRPDKKIYASINGSPIYDDNNEIKESILCIRDITEQVIQDQKIKFHQEVALQAEREKREMLEQTVQMKDEFLSIISHELRTPLNVINTAVQAMELLCKNELPDRAKNYIKIIRQNIFRQLRLVNNLLDITRAGAGRLNIHKKNIDIVFLSRAITSSVLNYASNKGITLTFESSIKKKIIGIDEEKYERILLNLLSNAIKFTPEGKSICVKLRSEGNKVCIEVKDTGIGIPKDKIGLIFERFGQVDSSLSRQAEGAGIGLSLVKRLVEASGGSISVKSKIGKGSTFKILLPGETSAEENGDKPMVSLMDNRLVEVTTVEFSDIYL